MSEENKNIKTTTIQSIDNFFKDMSNLNIPTKIQPEEKITQKPIDYVDIVKRGYKEILNRDADVADIKNYSNKLKYEILTENTFRDILRNSDEYKESNSNELVYCMIGGNKLHEIKPYIETVLPYIDSFIYVDSYSTDGTIEYLNELSSKNNDKIIVIQHEWEDRFSMFRNYYLNYLRDINYRGYVLVSDSVSGERCTTILNEKGHIEVISFDELFNIYSKISTPVIDENGKEIIINPSIKILSSTQPKIFNVNKMQDLRNYPEEMNYLLNSNQLKYLTLYKNGNGYKKIGKLLNVPWNNVLSILANLRNKKKFISIKSEWCNVKKIIRHKTNKNMLHINTKYGGTCVTKDHSLIEIKNDNYEKIEPDKFINNNKNFVSINNIYNDKLLNKIDLYDYIKNKDRILTDEEYIIFYRSYADKLPKIKRYYEGEDIEKLCEILGTFISEGSTTDNLFSIANSDKDWLEKIKNNIEKITIDCTFKYNTDIGNDKKLTIYHLRTYQNLIVDIFKDLCGNDSRTKKIPNFIYNLDNRYKKIFLDNLIKGDGWKNKEYWINKGKSEKYSEDHFGYTTTSLKLASGISVLLKTLNINHSVTIQTNSLGIKYYNILHKISYKEKNEVHQQVENVNTDNKEMYVYDLEVENSNIFTDSLGSVLLHNTDEHFPIETLSKLKDTISELETGSDIEYRYDGIKFQAKDIIIDDNDKNVIKSQQISNYWKSLMFKFYPEIEYEGEPHETIVGKMIRWKQTNLIYEHIRSQRKIWERAAENFFISNSNRYSDKWQEFRLICTTNKLISFKDFWILFKELKLPKDVEEWITKHKDDNESDGDSEIREMGKMYLEILPNEIKEKTKNLITENNVLKTEIKNSLNKIEEKLNTSDSVYPYYSESTTISPNIKLTVNSTDIKKDEMNKTVPKIEDIDKALQKIKNKNKHKFEITNSRCNHCYSNSIKDISGIKIDESYTLSLCKNCWIELTETVINKIISNQ